MLDDESYEIKAEAARRLLGLGDELKFTGVRLLEAAKAKGVIHAYTIVDDSVLPDKGGHYDGTNRVISTPAKVFSRSNLGVPRDVLSVLHEISHALLGHTSSRFRSYAKSVVEKAVPSIMREDREAERLAITILSPYRLANFVPTTPSHEIAQKFGLSDQAAAIRKGEFERLYRKANKLERPLPAIVIDYLKEADKRRRPTLSAIRRNGQRTPPAQVAVAVAESGYDDRPCPNCGRYQLASVSSKYLCMGQGCSFYGDLPDGD